MVKWTSAAGAAGKALASASSADIPKQPNTKRRRHGIAMADLYGAGADAVLGGDVAEGLLAPNMEHQSKYLNQAAINM